MRANPKFDAATAITELGVGEALVSFLDEKGRPAVVERSMIFPPASRLGPLSADERQAIIQASPLLATYGQTVDRESAYEILRGKPAASQPAPGAIPPPPAGRGGLDAGDWGNHGGAQAQPRPAPQPRQSAPAPQESSGGGLFGGLGDILTGSTGPRGGRREGMIEAAAKSAARGVAGTVGREIGKQILRGVLGSILGGRR